MDFLRGMLDNARDLGQVTGWEFEISLVEGLADFLRGVLDSDGAMGWELEMDIAEAPADFLRGK